MPAEACLGQALIQQVQQERREHLNDLLAHGDVCGIDMPGSGPVIEVRDSLAQALRVLRQRRARMRLAAHAAF